MGSFGYASRWEYDRKQEKSASNTPTRDAVLSALNRPPLEVRGDYVKRKRLVLILGPILPVLIGLCGVGIVLLVPLHHSSVSKRFDQAKQIEVAEVDLVTQFSSRQGSKAQLRWRRADGIDWEQDQVEALYFPDHPDVEFRQDAQGVITSLHVLGSLQVMFVSVGLGVLGVALFVIGMRYPRREKHELQLAYDTAETPVIFYTAPDSIQEVTKYGVSLGKTQYELSSSASSAERKTRTVVFGEPRQPIFNEEGQVLVALPKNRAHEVPILIGNDGYPFVIPRDGEALQQG